MTNAQTEARAIARKLQDVIEGHSWRLNIDKATGIIATALAAKDAELEKVKAECDKWREAFGEMHRQTMRAEASLVEKDKALEEMQPHIDKIERCIRVNDEMGRVVVGQTEAAKAIADIARRAREQGGDDVL